MKNTRAKAGSQDALVRRPVCPKCGCRRFRNIGSFGTVGHDNATAVAVYVECMRCEEMWDRKSPNSELNDSKSQYPVANTPPKAEESQ
jgi:hypothetical protein